MNNISACSCGRRSKWVIWCITLLLLNESFCLTAFGASKFWLGTVNGDFATGGNWVGGSAPAAGDDLVFQLGIAQLLVTNNFSTNRAFNSLLFQGSNYVVRGNAILVTNGINSINPNGPNTIDADVDVRASQAWEATGPLAVLDFNGDINLNANTLTVRANTGDFFMSGIISGTGNLVKTNVGTLRMDGSGHNTYSGFTRFDGGVLELDKFGVIFIPPSTFIVTNYTAIPGVLTVGDGNGLVGTDVLRLLADDQIADTSAVTVKNSGLMDLQDHVDRIASLTMQGGTVETGTGTLVLGGNLSTLADNNGALITGNLSLGGATRTFDISPGSPSADLRINAIISGGSTSIFITPGIIKTGGGSLFLAGVNSYNGITTVNDGQVALLADHALGATITPLGGSAGTVVNASGNLFLSGVQVTNEDLTINSANPGGAFNASGASIWTGDISLNTDTFIASSGSFLLNGAISGTGGFTKISTGSITLGGTNANTYTGTTVVRDGTLFLDKDTSLALDGAMSGPLVIGEDELPENTDIVRFLRCCQLPDDTDVTLNASGLLDLNGFGQNVRNITFNGGDITTGAGSILPIGDITVNANTNSQAIISGHMSVLSNPIINVTGHFFSPDLNITAQLFGAGGFTKNGVGELGLTAANTYTGTTTVNDGLLLVDDSSALGTTAGGTVVNNGAVLSLRFGVAVGAEPLTLSGTGQSAFGALSSSFGSNSWTGNIILSGDTVIYVDTSDSLNLLGGISGAFHLTKTGNGTLMFSGATANTYAGTSVNSGTLLASKTIANGAIPGGLGIGDGVGGGSSDVVRLLLDNQLADNAIILIANSGLLDLNDHTDTTGTIEGVGRIDLGSGTLRAGADNGSATFNGLLVGTGSLFKLGLGTWTLAANNTYSGGTTVSAGTLVVDGSQPQSDITVNGTATLGGKGTVGDVNVFGSLAPGASPGTLTTSNVVLRSSATDFFVELNGPAPGTGYDQVKARGTVALSNATLHATLSFQSAISNAFTIIDNDGADAVIGTFNGLPQGATLNISGIPFRISYSGGTGNDVVLTQLAALPVLHIQSKPPTNVVLFWPTNFAGYSLQFNANLANPVWTAAGPAPTVIGTNNFVTNQATIPQRFYRLAL